MSSCLFVLLVFCLFFFGSDFFVPFFFVEMYSKQSEPKLIMKKRASAGSVACRCTLTRSAVLSRLSAAARGHPAGPLARYVQNVQRFDFCGETQGAKVTRLSLNPPPPLWIQCVCGSVACFRMRHLAGAADSGALHCLACQQPSI